MPDPGQRHPAGSVGNDRLRARTGGTALRLPGAGWRARGLGRAALALDADTVRGLLAESIAQIGVQATWDDVTRPVLAAVAQRWADTGAGIEIEHLLSDCVTAVFSAVAATAAPAGTARPVLLAGMAGDQHRLPLVVLATTLAQRGVSCRSLGDRPACDGTGDGDPAHRTGRAAAVVPAEFHRRPAGPAVTTAHAPRISQLRRRPRLGPGGTPAAGRTARVARGGHRRAQRRRHGVTVARLPRARPREEIRGPARAPRLSRYRSAQGGGTRGPRMARPYADVPGPGDHIGPVGFRARSACAHRASSRRSRPSNFRRSNSRCRVCIR